MAKTKREKKGMCLYYSFLDVEFEEMNFEEIGLITTALLQFDYRKQVDEDLLKTINENQKLKILFREMSEKVKFATDKWERLQKGKEETEEVDEKPFIIKSPKNEEIKIEQKTEFKYQTFEFDDFNFNFYCKPENLPKNKDIMEFFEEIKMNHDIETANDVWHIGNADEWKNGWKYYF